MNDFIDQVLKKHLSSSIKIVDISTVSGGCINNAFKIKTNEGLFFLKSNKIELSDMFVAEAKGLKILNTQSAIKSPKVLGYGVEANHSYLLTEWIEKGHQSAKFWEGFGQNLAAQHQVSASTYGLDHDNYIGSLTQSNAQHEIWDDFFIHERLTPQLELGMSKSLISATIRKQFDVLFTKLNHLIPNEKPALLHGDLWSGNFMIDQSGEAATFDPAVHFGHRETEIAFTQLFGGFSPDFYHHYQSASPLEPGFDDRVDIHNLYPLLVHVNLFGQSYLSGIIQTLNRHT